MGNEYKCLVEGCNGVYVTKVIEVITLRGSRKINVVESICDKCGDDEDERLIRFIRENL